MFNPKEEVALDTLNLSELILQFKLMKAMGYKSLFDPGFRRELKNPFRKRLYYKVMMAEEAMDKQVLINALSNTTDRITFFADPELYKKCKDAENKAIMEDPTQSAELRREMTEKYGSKIKNHVVPDAEQQEKDLESIKKARPTRSMT